MKLLLIGDIVGKQGRKAVQQLVQVLRKEYECCFCIANGENMAGGAGLSENACKDLKESGVNVITSGDHVWDQKDFIHQISKMPWCLRPANLHEGSPGKGYGVYNIPIGGKIAVINLIGRVFMRLQSDCPFQAVEKIIEKVKTQTSTIIVDMHAEATSEKIAMGRFLDGKVTAVFGTHTHVPTADEQIFEGGTAYITDLGMTGSDASILGRAINPVVHRFSTGLPKRFTVEENKIRIHGAVVEFDQASGKALSIQRFNRAWQPSFGS